MELKQKQLISDCTYFYLCSIITARSQVIISETQCLLIIKQRTLFTWWKKNFSILVEWMTDTATSLVHVFPQNVTISKQVVVLQRKETLVPVISVVLQLLPCSEVRATTVTKYKIKSELTNTSSTSWLLEKILLLLLFKSYSLGKLPSYYF